MSQAPTGIEITTKVFFLMFLIKIFPLLVEIDGQEIKGTWGTQMIPVVPGTHNIKVAWKMYWIVPVNRGTTQVTLSDGQVAPLTYKPNWFWFLPGKLNPTPAAA